jgi:phospholipid/cholesterol/gamma-HCH transport system substrate-binding protein
VVVRFSHTGNVVRGAPVKFGGVTVGHVDAIVIEPDHRTESGEPLPVKMELGIQSEIARSLHADAEVNVATQGPLGEAYLELAPGSADAPPLKPGQEIRAREPFRIDQVIARLGRLLSSAGSALEKNPDILPNLIASLGRLTQKLDAALEANPQAMADVLTNLAETSRQLKVLATEAKETLGPKGKATLLIEEATTNLRSMKNHLPRIIANADTTLAGTARVASQLDEEDGKNLKLAIQRYTEAGEKLEQLSARADKIMAQVEAGQGTVGGVLKDPQIYLDIKALVAELKAHPWKVLWKD